MSFFPRKLLLLLFLLSTISFAHALHSHHHKRSHHLAHKAAVARASDDAVVTPSDDSISSTGITLREPRALFARQQAGGGSNTATSGDYTCGPGKPCGNKSCWLVVRSRATSGPRYLVLRLANSNSGASGWCGYGPKFCGDVRWFQSGSSKCLS